MTHECFLKGMVIFLATFSNIKADKKTQAVWCELLQDISDEEFIFAVNKICKEVREFYPTTNFVALIGEQIKNDTSQEAIMAYNAVCKARITKGAYASVKFSDPTIHSVLQLMCGGWVQFCSEGIDKWTQKQFVDLYGTMGCANNHPEYMKGIFEIENTASGYCKDRKQPKVIETGTGLITGLLAERS